MCVEITTGVNVYDYTLLSTAHKSVLFKCPSPLQLAGTDKRLQGTIVILTCSVSLASLPTNIFLKTGEMRLNRNLCALMLPEQTKKKLAREQ